MGLVRPRALIRTDAELVIGISSGPPRLILVLIHVARATCWVVPIRVAMLIHDAAVVHVAAVIRKAGALHVVAVVDVA
jgi:hypothetical protein